MEQSKKEIQNLKQPADKRNVSNSDTAVSKIDCQVKCNTIREKNFEAPRRESEN